MMNPMVGIRFCPTDEEIVNYYLRLKNLGDSSTTYVDQVMNTVNISSCDPWDLPSQSKIKSGDLVWYFFGVKDNKYNRGERQNRGTPSGYWKKTGVTMNIIRKRGGNREKIGEKRVLGFHWSNGSKSNWNMHEYQCHPTMSSSQMITYTVCKVSFKGEAKDMYPNSPGSEIDHIQSSIPHVNNYDGSGFDVEPGQPLIPRMNFYDGFEMDRQFTTDFHDLDALDKPFDDFFADWPSCFGDEQMTGDPNLG